MRATLAAAVLMAALAAPAAGADRQQWSFIASDGEGQLSYGVPDSGSLTIAFICRARGQEIEVVTTVVPRKPRAGHSIETTLANGAATAAYEATLGHTKAEGYYSGASAVFAPTVLDVVRSGTTLTISVPGRRQRVPLRGIADPLARFTAACFRHG